MPTEIKNEKWKELFNKQKSKTNSMPSNNERIHSYYFIYHCDANYISFVNSAYENITGFEAATFTVERLIEHIHPDDQPYFFSCEEKGLELTNALTFNEHFQYLLSYTYRIQKQSGEYIWIKQQCQAIEVNDRGDLTKTLVIHSIIEDSNYERPVNDYRIFDKSRNIYLDTENCYNLTKRELQILNLIQTGLSSQEIAETLFTSKYTVDTHRKNILRKTNSDNFIELIQKLKFS